MQKQTIFRIHSLLKHCKRIRDTRWSRNSTLRSFTSCKILYDSAGSSETKGNYFGYEEVSHEEKTERVQAVFSSVANKYDLMNDIMSGGIHRLWKDYLIDVLSPTQGTKLLDVAGGTGDIAFRFLKTVSSSANDSDQKPLTTMFEENGKETKEESSTSESHVVVLDLNENMLAVCKERAKASGFDKYITCVHGPAENLPFPDNSFDAYTIAFGIRNVSLIDKALSEALRVLRPGGRFLCLEFSEAQNPLLGWLYDQYSMQIIPCIGQIVAGDWKSYQYLVESIRKFPNQEDFQFRIEDSGFRQVTYENLFNGIATIHSAFKI